MVSVEREEQTDSVTDAVTRNQSPATRKVNKVFGMVTSYCYISYINYIKVWTLYRRLSTAS